MAHFLCHLGCSHFGALLLDFYFTENIVICSYTDKYKFMKRIQYLKNTTVYIKKYDGGVVT